MKQLSSEQVKRLIEENLTNKFRYYLDNMMDEKRPFGNSGFSSIQKDMMEIIGIKKTWEVSNEDELDELKYKWMEECFEDIKEWIDKNGKSFKVKLFAISGDGEQ